MKSKKVENPQFGVQKIQVLRFLAEHSELFHRQGYVVETWRPYRGRRLGPFYMLRYREGRRQRSVYLGRNHALAEEVRARLQQMQAAAREPRAADKLWARQRARLRELKAQWDRELRKIGLRLQGYEVRGRAGRALQSGWPRSRHLG